MRHSKRLVIPDQIKKLGEKNMQRVSGSKASPFFSGFKKKIPDKDKGMLTQRKDLSSPGDEVKLDLKDLSESVSSSSDENESFNIFGRVTPTKEDLGPKNSEKKKEIAKDAKKKAKDLKLDLKRPVKEDQNSSSKTSEMEKEKEKKISDGGRKAQIGKGDEVNCKVSPQMFSEKYQYFDIGVISPPNNSSADVPFVSFGSLKDSKKGFLNPKTFRSFALSDNNKEVLEIYPSKNLGTGRLSRGSEGCPSQRSRAGEQGLGILSVRRMHSDPWKNGSEGGEGTPRAEI